MEREGRPRAASVLRAHLEGLAEDDDVSISSEELTCLLRVVEAATALHAHLWKNKIPSDDEEAQLTILLGGALDRFDGGNRNG